MKTEIIIVGVIIAVLLSSTIVHDKIIDPANPWIPPILPSANEGIDLLMGVGAFEHNEVAWMFESQGHYNPDIPIPHYDPLCPLFFSSTIEENPRIARSGVGYGICRFWNMTGYYLQSDKPATYYWIENDPTQNRFKETVGVDRNWEYDPKLYLDAGGFWQMNTVINTSPHDLKSYILSPSSWYELRAWFKVDSTAITPALLMYMHSTTPHNEYVADTFQAHKWSYEWDFDAKVAEGVADPNSVPSVSAVFDSRDCYSVWKQAVLRFKTPPISVMEKIDNMWIAVGGLPTADKAGGAIFIDDLELVPVNDDTIQETKVKLSRSINSTDQTFDTYTATSDFTDMYLMESSGMGRLNVWNLATDGTQYTNFIKVNNYKYINNHDSFGGYDYSGQKSLMKPKVFVNQKIIGKSLSWSSKPDYDQVHGEYIHHIWTFMVMASDPVTYKKYYSNCYMIVEEQTATVQKYTAKVLPEIDFPEQGGVPYVRRIEIEGQQYFYGSDVMYFDDWWKTQYGNTITVIGWKGKDTVNVPGETRTVLTNMFYGVTELPRYKATITFSSTSANSIQVKDGTNVTLNMRFESAENLIPIEYIWHSVGNIVGYPSDYGGLVGQLGTLSGISSNGRLIATFAVGNYSSSKCISAELPWAYYTAAFYNTQYMFYLEIRIGDFDSLFSNPLYVTITK